MNIVLTAGTFDLLHEGHLNFLQTCRQIAGPDGEVHVWVNEDAFVEKFKHVRPVHDQYTRLNVIKNLKGVTHAELLKRGDMKRALARTYLVAKDIFHRALGSRGVNFFVVIGTDWAKRDYYAQIGMTREELEGLGYKLVYVEYTEGISSTQLRAKVQT